MNDNKYETYNKKLLQMLKVASIEMAPSYRPEQVLVLLNISQMTFRSMCDCWAPEPDHCESGGLESYVIKKQRRVPHHGLVEWLIANNSFDKQRLA